MGARYDELVGRAGGGHVSDWRRRVAGRGESSRVREEEEEKKARKERAREHSGRRGRLSLGCPRRTLSSICSEAKESSCPESDDGGGGGEEVSREGTEREWTKVGRQQEIEIKSLPSVALLRFDTSFSRLSSFKSFFVSLFPHLLPPQWTPSVPQTLPRPCWLTLRRGTCALRRTAVLFMSLTTTWDSSSVEKLLFFLLFSCVS